MKTYSISGGIVFGLTTISIWILLAGLSVYPAAPAGMEADSIYLAFETYIEEVVSELEPEEAEQLVEFLEALKRSPIDINSATKLDLKRLPFINEIEINQIIRIRKERGVFESENDLYYIDRIERHRIHLLMNFIFIGKSKREKRRAIPEITLRSYSSSEMQQRRGFREGLYLGSPVASHHRTQLRFTPSLHGGFLITKADGERSMLERKSGYLSGHFFNDKVNITAGDYRLQLGQGLLLSSGFGIAKSGNPVRGILHRSTGIRPAASRSEHYRFRGGTVSVQLPRLSAMIFYSNTPRAATVLDDGTVRTLITYPVYRTEKEREKKNALTETLYGSHLRYSVRQNSSVGLTWYSLNYDREFKPVIPGRFAGKNNDHAGIDWSIAMRNIHLFGEAASSLPVSNPAILSGIMISVQRGLEAAALYRYYPADYLSMYGSPFSERRGAANDESGIYLGLRYRPAPRHLLEGFFDLYTFSNYARSPGFPVNGSDILFRTEIPAGAQSIIDIRIRRRSRFVSVNTQIDDINERILTDRVQNNIRLSFTSTPHRWFRFRIQHERIYVLYPGNNANEKGAYAAADIRWNFLKNLGITARYILFGTDSYDSRLYTSEYDMPGRVRTILLNGKGSVISAGLQASLGNFNLSMKYIENFRSDGANIGTGYQEINGPLLGVIMVQIDARL